MASLRSLEMTMIARMRPLRRRTACLLLALAPLATPAPRPQSYTPRAPSVLLLRVVDSATRVPVPNAEVTAWSKRGLTDARGEVRVLYPEDGILRVRVRQLGFRYVDRTFRRDSASRADEDTAVVAIPRMGFALPQVVVHAERRCKDGGNAERVPLAQASMELLRFGAEQFDNFRRAYPFDISMERRTASTTSGRSMRRTLEVDTTASSAWGDRYVPGKVVVESGRDEYFVPLLFVSALADSVFWDRHCFVARGVESRDGRRLIRLDFSPTLDVREPDWEGSAWLDSARSVLARVDFRLTNLRRPVGLQQLEGYTVFSTPTPYIAMPESTLVSFTVGVHGGTSWQVRTQGARQSLVIRDVAYRKERPPGVQR
jgi:hypothetical protein